MFVCIWLTIKHKILDNLAKTILFILQRTVVDLELELLPWSTIFNYLFQNLQQLNPNEIIIECGQELHPLRTRVAIAIADLQARHSANKLFLRLKAI